MIPQNKKLNFIVSTDPTYDVVKLSYINPGDEYYLSSDNNENIMLSKTTFKNLFTTSLSGLKNLLNDIVIENFNKEITNQVLSSFDNYIYSYCDNFLDNFNILNYKGTYDNFPISANIGEIYKISGSYYIADSSSTFTHFITENDISKKYYTKNELDLLLSEITEQLNQMSLIKTQLENTILEKNQEISNLKAQLENS